MTIANVPSGSTGGVRRRAPSGLFCDRYLPDVRGQVQVLQRGRDVGEQRERDVDPLHRVAERLVDLQPLAFRLR